MNEKKLYQNLKKHWTGYLKRIELKNEVGIPDCHMISSRKDDIFLELKFMGKEFKSSKLPIKNTQFIWFAEYAGRNAFMLFQVAEKYFLFSSRGVKHLKGKVEFEKFEKAAIKTTGSIKDMVDYLR